MNEPKVNIIVVNHNERQNLEVCLKSLLEQSYENYDVTVSDNGSKDGSLEFIRKCFPQVRLIENGSNFGYSEGNNIGVRLTEGDYVAVANNDMEFDRDWLKNLMEVIRTDERIGAVTSKMLFFDDRDRINCLGNAVHFSGLIFCHKIGQPSSEYNETLEVPTTSGAAFVVSRKLINKYGFLDNNFGNLFGDDYWMSMEDTDFSWRLRLAGYKIMSVSGSVVYHKYNLKFSPRKLYYLECGRYLWVLKNYACRTILLFLPSFFLTEKVVWAFAFSRGSAYIRSKFRSYVWLIRKRREIIERRKEQQAIRTVSDKVMLGQTVQKIEPNPLMPQSKFFKLALAAVNLGYVVLFKAARFLSGNHKRV
jgi:GT2 family glycosyltransferase